MWATIPHDFIATDCLLQGMIFTDKHRNAKTVKALQKYKTKRNFSGTPEPKPKGKSSPSAKKRSFVVQEHDASHHHFDFRLESDGVLKSWAIPKGPSMDPKVKRLAVMVEDHPLSYGKFEGEIPKGNYGAGTVAIWDKGWFEPEEGDTKGSIEKDIRKGTIKFQLHGEKLEGSFALVRIKDGKEKNWLLIKHKDATRRKVSAKSVQKTKKATVNKTKQMVSVGGHQLQLTNLDKVLWPREGIKKSDLIYYYNSIHRYILPYLKDRPQSLKRNPNGIEDKGFYQKYAAGDAPSWVENEKILAESTGKQVNYIVCNDQATLAYLNNLGCIEINPWNSRVDHLDHPDYLVIDIDPSSTNSFNQVIDTTLAVREILKKGNINGYCKTSGASGMHIYIPLGARYNYDDVRPLAELIAKKTNELLPSITTMERALNKRRNRIYLDYLQNSRGQTLACAYSVRPVQGASVSAPLEWKEVKHGLSPLDFTIHNMAARIERKGDLFKKVLTASTDIREGMRLISE